MNEERKSKVFFSLFFILVIGLIGAGTYFLYFNKPTKEDKLKNTSNKIKVDQSKNLIYFEGIEPLSVDLALIYQYPVINIKGEEVKKINETLKNANEAIKGEVVKLDSVSEEERNKAIEPMDNIYSAKMRDYQIFQYDEYLSLLIREYTYNCTGKEGISEYSSYVFNVTTGEVYNQSDVLKARNVLFSTIQSKIKSHLEDGFNPSEGDQINIDKTINELNDNMVIYIDKEGYINVLYLAKSDNNTYNDSIIIK